MSYGRRGGSRCCVRSCSNYQLYSPGVSFHVFPRDAARRKQWMDVVVQWNSGRPLSENRRALVCSDHFLPECYDRNLRLMADAGFSTKFARLRTDAVPSVLSDRRTAIRDQATAVSFLECSTSTASTPYVFPTATTLDGSGKNSGAHGSLLNGPVSILQNWGRDQCTTTAQEWSSSAAMASDILSVGASSDVFEPDLEPPRHSTPNYICLSTLAKGAQTPLWNVSKGVQTEELHQTSTGIQASITPPGLFHHDACPDNQCVLAVTRQSSLEHNLNRRGPLVDIVIASLQVTRLSGGACPMLMVVFQAM
ncbi:uncharacterized protein ISCGN_019759 [Ixodes scapularis]